MSLEKIREFCQRESDAKGWGLDLSEFVPYDWKYSVEKIPEYSPYWDLPWKVAGTSYVLSLTNGLSIICIYRNIDNIFSVWRDQFDSPCDDINRLHCNLEDDTLEIVARDLQKFLDKSAIAEK